MNEQISLCGRYSSEEVNKTQRKLNIERIMLDLFQIGFLKTVTQDHFNLHFIGSLCNECKSIVTYYVLNIYEKMTCK